MATGFDYLAQAGTQNAVRQAQERDAEKQQKRNAVAALYLNAIQTPLPKTDDPAYAQALAKREDLMKQYVSEMGPEQHASFGQHLHGLIFGAPEAAQPVHGNAPEPPPAPQSEPPISSVSGAPQSTHPFATNPVYAKIQEGLKALGSHLKAGAHPLPPEAQPDYASLAAAPTAEQRKYEESMEMEKAKSASALAVANAKQKLPTEQQRFLDSYATKIKKPIDQWTPEDFESANKEYKASVTAAVRPSQAALATYIRAKYGDNPTAEQIAQGTREHQAMMAGQTVGSHQQLVFDDQGLPHVVTLSSSSKKDFGVPKSSQAPDATNPGARVAGTKPGGGAVKAKPKSSQSPALHFTRGDPTVKSDLAQYTKVAEDANMKKESYESARKAIASGSTASSDQELIYAWVRSNVQGAGRMTQAEFRQAASTGSLPLRAQSAWERTKSGKLPPELEQMFLADMKRSAETSQGEADTLRQRLSPKSSQALQVPDGTAEVWTRGANGKLVKSNAP